MSRFTASWRFFTRLWKNIPKFQYFARPGNKPWYTAQLHRLKRIRDRLLSCYCKSSGAARVTAGGAYKAVRNVYVAELRRAERHFFRKINHRLSTNSFHQNDRQWWALARSVGGFTTENSIPPLEVDGNFVLSSMAKAESLSKFFAELSFLNETPDSVPPVERVRPQGNFQFSSITTEKVLQQLQRLDVTKSCGLDGIGNNILRSVAPAISFPLARIFNASLVAGKFPTTWKSAVVVPLFKQNGDRCLFVPTSVIDSVHI